MEYKDALTCIKDGIKFVQIFAGAIDKSTPHLYLSGLPFLPSKSVMGRGLLKGFTGIAHVAVGMHDNWPRNQHILQGHTDWVWSVAFSPDGRHIVSGSGDRTIRVWDAQTGDQVGNPLQGHTDQVQSISFSPDGRHIVSDSGDGTVCQVDAQTGDLMDNNRQRTKLTTIEFLSICFSSSPTHALHHASSLFIDMSDDMEDPKGLVHLQNDGWIVGPNGKLLLWIPSSYRSMYFYAPHTNLVIPKGGPELDLSRMAHGPNWHKCYTSLPSTMAM